MSCRIVPRMGGGSQDVRVSHAQDVPLTRPVGALPQTPEFILENEEEKEKAQR